MLLCVVIITNVTLELNNEHVKGKLCVAQANLKLSSLFGIQGMTAVTQ
jgi:uncharacterized membrane protein YciS (DUF1049 family)